MMTTTTTAGAQKQSWGEYYVATVALVLTIYTVSFISYIISLISHLKILVK